MKLVKYRDAGMNTYTYFWVNEKDRMISPFFDSENDAIKWSNDGNNDSSATVQQALHSGLPTTDTLPVAE